MDRLAASFIVFVMLHTDLSSDSSLLSEQGRSHVICDEIHINMGLHGIFSFSIKSQVSFIILLFRIADEV